MRKIESAEEIDKRRSRRAKILSLFMLIILAASSIGYSFMSGPGDEQTGSVDEGKVQQMGNQWVASFQGQSIVLSTSPEAAAEVPVNIEYTLSNYAGSPAYIV